ncbi:PIN domain-containing protein [Legionella beliardensis]|uniref:PIN domain-containing protein n=1 Tax=Legionella beliardensis TaxID=91822 RepID=UPI0013586A07
MDTNIYLDFYEYSTSDLESLEKLSESLTKEHVTLFINKQLKDEFIKNRGVRINKAHRRSGTNLGERSI